MTPSPLWTLYTQKNFNSNSNKTVIYVLFPCKFQSDETKPCWLLLFLLLPWLLRLLEGHLSPVMCQSPPGLCQLQKWRQPGSEVPTALQAASEPSSSLWPGQRWATPWVRKTLANKSAVNIHKYQSAPVLLLGFSWKLILQNKYMSGFVVFFPVCACFRSLTTSESWCAEVMAAWDGSSQRSTNSIYTNK